MARKESGSYVKNEGQNGGGKRKEKNGSGKPFEKKKPNIDNEQTHE